MNSCVLHTGFRLDWALGCIQIQKMHLSLIPISLSQWGCIYVQQAVGFHTCQQHTPLIHSYDAPQDEVMRQLAAKVSCVKFVWTFWGISHQQISDGMQSKMCFCRCDIHNHWCGVPNVAGSPKMSPWLERFLRVFTRRWKALRFWAQTKSSPFPLVPDLPPRILRILPIPCSLSQRNQLCPGADGVHASHTMSYGAAETGTKGGKWKGLK